MFENAHINGQLYYVLLFGIEGKKPSINTGNHCIQMHYHS